MPTPSPNPTPPVRPFGGRHVPAICFAIGLLASCGLAATAADQASERHAAAGDGTEAHSAAPPLPQYTELREALARYRELAGNPAWQKNLPPLPGDKLTPGQPYAGTPLLVQRLTLLGDLPAGTPPSSRYEGAIVDGLRAFQERHGLTPDGVIGKGTFEQLNVAPDARVRQLELALERLRLTPLPDSPRAIVVNVQVFRLRA